MSAPTLSLEHLRLLVQVERQMDSGEVPWVRVEGASTRAAMRPEVMEALGLQTGQTISWPIFGEILKLNLASAEEELAFQRGQTLANEVLADPFLDDNLSDVEADAMTLEGVYGPEE
jgi:hypothetical protein